MSILKITRSGGHRDQTGGAHRSTWRPCT